MDRVPRAPVNGVQATPDPTGQHPLFRASTCSRRAPSHSDPATSDLSASLAASLPVGLMVTKTCPRPRRPKWIAGDHPTPADGCSGPLGSLQNTNGLRVPHQEHTGQSSVLPGGVGGWVPGLSAQGTSSHAMYLVQAGIQTTGSLKEEAGIPHRMHRAQPLHLVQVGI